MHQEAAAVAELAGCVQMTQVVAVGNWRQVVWAWVQAAMEQIVVSGAWLMRVPWLSEWRVRRRSRREVSWPWRVTKGWRRLLDWLGLPWRSMQRRRRLFGCQRLGGNVCRSRCRFRYNLWPRWNGSGKRTNVEGGMLLWHSG